MRSTPEQFNSYSVVQFDLAGAGTAEARFDMLASDHGDGNSFTWTASGGEREYLISRIGLEGYEPDFGYPMHKWLLVVKKQDKTETSIIVDCLRGQLTDIEGNDVPSESVNEVFRAVVDAADEREVLDRKIQFFTLPGGDVTSNPSYLPFEDD